MSRTNKAHLIFDLGGTLIFDPFPNALAKLAQLPLRSALEEGLQPSAVDPFLQHWKATNNELNFPFAGHFLQEEVFITYAAWPAYTADLIQSRARFPIWTTELLMLYRDIAFEIVSKQPHLPDLCRALAAARERNYMLLVASNDRYWATAALLEAAGLADLFDLVATSEGLSFVTPGAEKPSQTFFGALQRGAGLDFTTTPTFYIGDDESRDVLSAKELPLKTVRFFGNPSQSKIWVDNSHDTAADLQFGDYSELQEMISKQVFEN